MKLKTLHDAFVQELQELYHAEQQLKRALPRMAAAATDEELAGILEQHLEETHEQINRLDQIFEEIDTPSGGETCEAMAGLIKEGTHIVEEEAAPEVRDALLIGIIQKIEHFEIASYGTARTFANLLDLENAADLLQTTLDEESAIDTKLTELAVSSVNEKANAAVG